MHGYHQRYSTPNPKTMIQVSHPLQDTRPKTTHITSSLSRNFPLHKTTFYKNYKYNILTSNGVAGKGGKNPASYSSPNLTSSREQVTFPMWSKPFRPAKQSRNSTKRGTLNVTSVGVTSANKIEGAPARRGTSRPPGIIKERTSTDLPPIVKIKDAPGTPPPIRVTFKYHDRISEAADQSGLESGEEAAGSEFTLQTYMEFLRKVGHADLTHNSYTKVEMWLAELERDGTWPVQWFTTKR